MATSEQDIKLLWGRAAERCSFPECGYKLTMDRKLASGSFPLGEQAHIVGKTKTAPRGISNLTRGERDSYYNLILLCPTHHEIVDRDPKEYTVEKLHLFKDRHERWVEHTLSQAKDSTVQSVVYAELIDATVSACQLETWTEWASRAVSTTMKWDDRLTHRLFPFYNKVLGAVWPKTLPELECAIKRLTYEVYEANQIFLEHCKPSRDNDEILVEDRFYHSERWLPDEEYRERFAEYEYWQKKCYTHMRDATKAANWLADVVRRDVNPFFFATKGKFHLIMGPYDMLEFRSYFFEYTEEEKKKLLASCDKTWGLGKQWGST